MTGDKGYCDFGESNSGFCKYCSDVNGNCTDPATNATNGEQECEYICEGKYCNILQSHGKYLIQLIYLHNIKIILFNLIILIPSKMPAKG